MEFKKYWECVCDCGDTKWIDANLNSFSYECDNCKKTITIPKKLLSEELEDKINSLKDKTRIILKKCFIEEMSESGIAETTGFSKSSVHYNLGIIERKIGFKRGLSQGKKLDWKKRKELIKNEIRI